MCIQSAEIPEDPHLRCIKQKKICTRPEIFGSQLWLKTEEEQIPWAGNTLLDGCSGKPCLKFVRDPQLIAGSSLLPSNENHLPGGPPPSSRPSPNPFSHSEAPTAGPQTMIGEVHGRCLRTAFRPWEKPQLVYSGGFLSGRAHLALFPNSAPWARWSLGSEGSFLLAG